MSLQWRCTKCNCVISSKCPLTRTCFEVPDVDDKTDANTRTLFQSVVSVEQKDNGCITVALNLPPKTNLSVAQNLLRLLGEKNRLEVALCVHTFQPDECDGDVFCVAGHIHHNRKNVSESEQTSPLRVPTHLDSNNTL